MGCSSPSKRNRRLIASDEDVANASARMLEQNRSAYEVLSNGASVNPASTHNAAFGVASKRADSALMPLEKRSFEEAMVSKHAAEMDDLPTKDQFDGEIKEGL